MVRHKQGSRRDRQLASRQSSSTASPARTSSNARPPRSDRHLSHLRELGATSPRQRYRQPDPGLAPHPRHSSHPRLHAAAQQWPQENRRPCPRPPTRFLNRRRTSWHQYPIRVRGPDPSLRVRRPHEPRHLLRLRHPPLQRLRRHETARPPSPHRIPSQELPTLLPPLLSSRDLQPARWRRVEECARGALYVE